MSKTNDRRIYPPHMAVVSLNYAAVLSHAYLSVIVQLFSNPGTIVKPRMTVTVFDYWR